MKEDILTGPEKKVLYGLVVGDQPIRIRDLVSIFVTAGASKARWIFS